VRFKETKLKIKSMRANKPATCMTRNGLIATCFVCLLIAGVGRAHGLDPSRHITQYAHTSWRIQDGVFSGAPNAIVQTTDGYLWIGTQNGLVRFDGVRFIPWVPPNGKLLSSGIFSLLAEPDGSLWIGTGRNLARFKDGNLINYTGATGRINAILKRNGTVWVTRSRFGDGGGPLCEVVDTSLRCYGKADGIARPYAGPAIDDGEGNLWIGSANFLTRWRAGSSTTMEPPGLKGAEGLSGVQALAVTGDGSIWAGINRRGPGLGLQQLSHGVWKPFVAAKLDGSTLEVTTLFLDHRGTLWVGTTDEGIYRINGEKTDRFSSADGLSGDSVSGFYEDREGNLWVATSEGIDYLRNIPVITFSTHEGLSANFVYSVLAARDGTVWIGNHGALEFLGQAGLSSIRAKNGLPGERVTSLLEDHAGRLWVGVDNELYVYDGGKFRQVRHPKSAPLGVITAIAQDRDGTVWAEAMGSPTKLVRIQNGEVREEIPAPRVPIANAIAAAPHRGIWLGLVSGDLARYQNGQLETFPMPAKNGGIRQILVGPDGSVLGASAAGLVDWWNGRLRTLTSQNGLPCDKLYGLVLDSENSLWLYAECGLVKLASKELLEWRNNANTIVKVETFDIFDGARPWSTTFQPSASRSPDGRLWFANENVVQMIDPGNLDRNAVSPPVHVEEVLADHKTYSSTARVRLPPRTRDIEIDYTALSFVAPQKVRFRYKLEGRDASWQEPGTRRQAFYSDLPPGKYRFRVIACNNDGVWNDEGATLDFNVTPAWFQTIWFRTLCVVAFFLSLGGLYQMRLRQMRHQFNVSLEARVNERTRIARELHDTLLQSFNALLLRLQTAADLLSTRPEEAKHTLDSTIDQTAQALIEGRDAVQQLRSTSPGTNELVNAIGSLGKALAGDGFNRDASAFHLEVEGTPQDLLPIARDEVYRIAGEALRNAFRHARARRVEVDIRYDRRQLRVQIRDDGQGIDSQLLRTDGLSGHYGLRGMRERAQSLGGELTIWSEVNSGTEIDLTVPSSSAYTKPGLSVFRILPTRRQTKS
jgi:signal transduction histidine kinase/ligand-binding sensor domain-containing protein